MLRCTRIPLNKKTIDVTDRTAASAASAPPLPPHPSAGFVVVLVDTTTCRPVLRETFDIAKGWTMSIIEWIAKLSLRVKVFFLIFVKLANTLRVEVEIGSINARIRKVGAKQWRCTRDYDAMKGAVLVELHERLLKTRALYALHDFGALATYRAAQEAAAAEAAATKAMALKAAIDTVAAEQAARDKGGGGCVLS